MSTADTRSSVSLSRRPQSSADSAEPEAPAAPKPARKRKLPVWVLVLACMAVLGGAGAWYWWQQQLNALPPYIAAANGRLEAEQVEIATKYAGRIAVVLAKEGDTVQAGQVLARMDTAELEAQLQSAKAQVRKAGAKKLRRRRKSFSASVTGRSRNRSCAVPAPSIDKGRATGKNSTIFPIG